MGFFDKLKENITQGGVDVKLAAAGTAYTNNPYNFIVNITASGEPRVINRVSGNLYREERNAVTSVNQNGERQGATMLASSENTESFTLNPGETRQVPMTFVIGGSDPSALPGALGTIAGAFQKIGRFTGGRSNYIYTLRAEVDVEGIILDPGDDQHINIIEAASPQQPQVPPQPTV